MTVAAGYRLTSSETLDQDEKFQTLLPSPMEINRRSTSRPVKDSKGVHGDVEITSRQ